MVLFSTPDSAVLFTGVAWNAETGSNISDAFLPGVPRLVVIAVMATMSHLASSQAPIENAAAQ